MSFPKPIYANSAGRLLAYVSSLAANRPATDIVPPLFGLGGNTPEERQEATVHALGQIHSLYREFLEDVKTATANEAQQKVLINGLAGLRGTIFPGNLQAGIRGATEAEKSLLEMAATMIPEDQLITDEEIVAIRKSIADLGTLLTDPTTSAAIQQLIREMVAISEAAIVKYNVFGARGLRRAFKKLLGEFAETFGAQLNQQGRAEAKKSRAWTAVTNHLQIFDTITSRLSRCQPLLSIASAWLLDGPQE